MSPRRFFFVFAILLCACTHGRATGTIVLLETSLGNMTFELYDTDKPLTVANFLKYIRSGRYVLTFAHRLNTGFVLQGGSFTWSSLTGYQSVSAYPAVANEAGPFPAYSNVKGTLSMAKLPDDPDSATSGWFVNLADNSTNLDAQNDGFTVFGKILTGAAVMDALNAFTAYAGTDGENLILNVGSPLDSMPVFAVTGARYLYSDLVYTKWSIVNDPVPAITSEIGVQATRGVPFRYQIAATETPTSYSITEGTLPDGLSADTTTGLISGTPTTTGLTVVTVNATNVDGTGGSPLMILVSDPPPPSPAPVPPAVTTKKKVTGTRGHATLKGTATADTVKVEVRVGKKPFKPASGSPAGWKFVIKGLKDGKYKAQVRATNSDGKSVIQPVTVLIKN